jgi:hypothetical protein
MRNGATRKLSENALRLLYAAAQKVGMCAHRTNIGNTRVCITFDVVDSIAFTWRFALASLAREMRQDRIRAY